MTAVDLDELERRDRARARVKALAAYAVGGVLTVAAVTDSATAAVLAVAASFAYSVGDGYWPRTPRRTSRT